MFSDFVNYFLMFLKTYHVLGSVYCVVFGRKFECPSIPWHVSKNVEIFFKVWKFGQDKFAILRYLDLCLILFLFHFDELTDASMRKESTILLQTAMARHVTLKTAYLKPETNGILTENHFNICTSHPICMKLTKFDKIWHEMEAHEEMFNTLEYLQHIICHFGLFYEFFWLKHPNIGIFFLICCQKLRIVHWHQRSNILM